MILFTVPILELLRFRWSTVRLISKEILYDNCVSIVELNLFKTKLIMFMLNLLRHWASPTDDNGGRSYKLVTCPSVPPRAAS